MRKFKTVSFEKLNELIMSGVSLLKRDLKTPVLDARDAEDLIPAVGKLHAKVLSYMEEADKAGVISLTQVFNQGIFIEDPNITYARGAIFMGSATRWASRQISANSRHHLGPDGYHMHFRLAVLHVMHHAQVIRDSQEFDKKPYSDAAWTPAILEQ